MTMDEIDLDSAASRKTWNKTYAEPRLTATRAAAFTGAVRSKKAKSLFDEDEPEGDSPEDSSDLYLAKGIMSRPRSRYLIHETSSYGQAVRVNEDHLLRTPL